MGASVYFGHFSSLCYFLHFVIQCFASSMFLSFPCFVVLCYWNTSYGWWEILFIHLFFIHHCPAKGPISHSSIQKVSALHLRWDGGVVYLSAKSWEDVAASRYKTKHAYHTKKLQRWADLPVWVLWLTCIFVVCIGHKQILSWQSSVELHLKKTCLQDFRPGKTQTGLLSDGS